MRVCSLTMRPWPPGSVGADRVEGEDEAVQHCLGKDHVGTVRSMIGERRFVESPGLHHTVVGQMFDDEVHEADLIDGERRVGKEVRERLCRRLAVETDQRADEQAQLMLPIRSMVESKS